MSRKVLRIARRAYSETPSEPQQALSLVEKMKLQWKENPSRVPIFWQDYFRLNPHLVGKKTDTHDSSEKFDVTKELFVYDQIQMHRIINMYQSRGHLMAATDPLHIKRRKFIENNYRLPEDEKSCIQHMALDKEKKIVLPSSTFIGGYDVKALKMRDLMIRLNSVYCNTIGLEFVHNSSLEITTWIRRKFEDPNLKHKINSPSIKKLILQKLIRATLFETFYLNEVLNTKHKKRHGIIGCEVIIPALQYLVNFASSKGGQMFILGMNTTRARLNILANVFRKSLMQLFVPFKDHGIPESSKYTLGSYAKKVTSDQAYPTEYSVIANNFDSPDGSEAIVSGKIKAEQKFSEEENKVWAIVIHDDETAIGQGALFETMRLTRHRDYFTGGTIHIILTDYSRLPDYSNSSSCYYPSDVARAVMAPVFHVNSRDPEAVMYCMQVAAEYRLKFELDVIVNIITYSWGHETNQEIDAKEVKRSMRPLVEAYGDKLIEEKIVTRYFVIGETQKYNHFLEFNLSKARRGQFEKGDWMDSPWKRFHEEKLQYKVPMTGIVRTFFKEVFDKLHRYKVEINIHPEISAAIAARKQMIENEKITFSAAEMMVFSCLLEEGFHIRLTGDKVEDNKLTKRYYVLHSMDSKVDRYPIIAQFKEKAEFTFTNTISAEMSILGFEIGYAQSDPKVLVVWQSHDEDRANVAQYMIDIFLASGEARWFRQCGLVCLLPHGLEGQGTERSSARPERYLQMCSDDEFHPEFEMGVQLNRCNWIIANVTTPANYFHIIRRQMKFNFRKPLMLFMLKKPFGSDMISPLEEILGRTQFKVYIPDVERTANPENVKKVLLCTGQVYYDLYEYRKKYDPNGNIAICRLEQISPFPYKDSSDDLKKYKNASVFWVQEEHKNQGWWDYVRPRVKHVMRDTQKCEYIGRPHSPFRATHDYNIHMKEKETFLLEAMKL